MADNPTSDGGDGLSEEPLTAVRRAVEQRDTQREALRRATEHLAVVMRQARSLGVAWDEIAAELGMPSGGAAQKWAHNNSPQLENPGYSVTEAARRLGVSRPTVYARIQEGELSTVIDEQGRRWVLLPPA